MPQIFRLDLRTAELELLKDAVKGQRHRVQVTHAEGVISSSEYERQYNLLGKILEKLRGER